MMNEIKWPKVFVVVLNWNGWKDTIECLESLYGISYPNYEVVVVDNNSQDDSLARINAYARGEIVIKSSFFSNSNAHSLRVTELVREEAEGVSGSGEEAMPEHVYQSVNKHLVIIKNEQNFGYSEGNNIGMRYALKAAADYILLLNNDTVVHKDFLTELVRVAEQDENIGAIGPKICFYDAPQVIQSTGARINFWTGRAIALYWKKGEDVLESSNSQKLLSVDYIYGACFLISRRIIEEVGELDPQYFLYGEEVDWCIRISRAGYRIVCDVDSKIWHKGMASTSKEKRFSLYYLERNRVIYERKYARTSQFLSFLLYYPVYYVVFLAKKRRAKDIPCFIKGFIDGLFVHLDRSP
jgi:GT2 family glycosyltransferase